ILFIFTPLSFERSSSCSGVIISVSPHQRGKHWTRVSLLLELISSAYPVPVPVAETRVQCFPLFIQITWKNMPNLSLNSGFNLYRLFSFIFPPLSHERPFSCSGLIIPARPHRREAMDSSFTLIR
ncbi:hypothetical protein CSKR_106367, partial [Clonorchis sinensis]